MQQEVRVDIGELLRFIRNGLIPALLVAGVGAYLAYELAQRQDPVFEARATVLVAQTNPSLREFGLSIITAPPLDVTAYREAGTSDSVLRTALNSMGVAEPELGDIRSLAGDIRLEADNARSSSVIHVIGEGSTPEAAANRANAVASALVQWDRARAAQGVEQLIEGLELQIANLTDQIRSLQTLSDPELQDQITGRINLRAEQQEQLSYARALSASASAVLSVMQQASPPPAPVAPRPVLNAAIAFLLGLVVAYGLLLLRRALDTRLRGVEDLAHVTGLPVLAEFPPFRHGDRNTLREASSYLRTNLLFATTDAHPKVLLVTSAQAAEGKTVTSTSLAEGFVRNGYRTLLVDADMRSPSVAKLYRIPARNRASLADWLRDPYEGHQPVEVNLGPEQALQVVPVFQPVGQPAEMLSMGFRSCLEKWRQEFDVIVIDTAPILAVADTLAIAPLCTGTVLVTHVQKTDRNQARTAVDLLRRIGVRILGVAANHVRPEGGRRQAYGYGYGGESLAGTPHASPARKQDGDRSKPQHAAAVERGATARPQTRQSSKPPA